MSKFKAGDIVRRKAEFQNSSAKWDREFEVVSCEDTRSSSNFVLKGTVTGAEHMTRADGNSHGWDAYRFELVRSAGKFKVGDKVRRVKHQNWGRNYSAGSVFLVVDLDRDGDPLDEYGDVHLTDNVELYVEPVVEPAGPFKVGDVVRRKIGHGTNGGKREGEAFTVAKVRAGGWVESDTHRAGHNPDFLELVPAEPVPAAPSFGIEVEVETVTTSTVKGGRIETDATNASIEWKDSDSDGDILVIIDGMFMKAADLRQAADLFKALADKLESITK